MGCTGGTRSVFTSSVSGEKRTSLYISLEKAILLHPNTAERSFFPLQSFQSGKLEKLARKRR